jgi:U6 snRNA-associated Sm-like protein LSm6
MNIAMEQTEEYVDGQLKNRYGDCFLRGNNGKLSDDRHHKTIIINH